MANPHSTCHNDLFPLQTEYNSRTGATGAVKFFSFGVFPEMTEGNGFIKMRVALIFHFYSRMRARIMEWSTKCFPIICECLRQI